MNITIELPAFAKFTRAGHEMQVDLGPLSPDIVARLVVHGLAQKVGDAAAGKKGDEALAAMLTVIDSLRAGEWGRERTGKAEATDPVERLARKLAREWAAKELKAKGKKWSALDEDAQKAIEDRAWPKFEQIAREQIAAKAGITVDLSDLGL